MTTPLFDLLDSARRDAHAPLTSSPNPDPKLETKLAHLVGRCIEQWRLIEEGDHIMVGISGGKDSYTLLHMLMRMQRVSPVKFTLLPFHLDQGHPEFPTYVIRDYLTSLGVPFVIHSQDTYSIVVDKLQPGQTTCSLCSRMRRGILYNQAVELGCNKIALGHHRDDAIETLLLNIFYSGQLKAMPAKLRSDDGRNTVIRPLLLTPEHLIVKFAQQAAYPIVPCTLCSRQPDLKRDAMDRLMQSLEADNPNIRGNLFAALSNVVPSHLLDRRLFDLDPDSEGADSGAVSADAFLDELDVG
jgi:tRNA 2-thiocytidine biosynthesis protein TtcA